MILGGLCILFFFFFFYSASFHSLVVLMFVEFVVVFTFFFLGLFYADYYSCLFFILVSVCLGGYGVSLIISCSNSSSLYSFLMVDIF